MVHRLGLWMACGLIFLAMACQEAEQAPIQPKRVDVGPSILVLGTAQDAGSPQAGCYKECCRELWVGGHPPRRVTSLGLRDGKGKYWMFEASPDFPAQMSQMSPWLGQPKIQLPAGIFLTHAHIGHYTGLMHLGREVYGAQEIPVYTMPRMAEFIRTNGPWSQLVDLNNIELRLMKADSLLQLSAEISVQPVLVPHRDEFSETVGFKIQGPHKSLLFIPDIDKWSKWGRDLKEEVKKHDWVLIDGTFFSGKELPGRDMAEIPHPSVEESMAYLKGLDSLQKSKVVFIHLNHTNPLWNKSSQEFDQVQKAGYSVAYLGQEITL
ncbi:pyrroloquinoline quinone biosynthesis protein PqqB [bacterium SCSIO 12741]|nr:pyrroloquinoline quinone biosynthesis protein PqqB [bacterium SCSIO 12741]